MNNSSFAMMEFISASTAGIIHCEIGYVPDFVILIADHGGTNPLMYMWANGGRTPFAGWDDTLSLVTTGASGIITRDTSGISAYAGGDVIGVVETANTVSGTVNGTASVLGKHVHRAAGIAATHAAAGRITQAGVSIPIDHQVNSGRNLLLAFRNDM